jgi:hypothetical protein
LVPAAASIHYEAAPDVGYWTFDMRPLVVKSLTAAPRTPHAGARFVLTMSAIRTATAETAAGKVACVFNIAGAGLRPSRSAHVGGRARCVFDIPITAKSKSFRSSIAIRVGVDRIERSIVGTIS